MKVKINFGNIDVRGMFVGRSGSTGLCSQREGFITTEGSTYPLTQTAMSLGGLFAGILRLFITI